MWHICYTIFLSKFWIICWNNSKKLGRMVILKIKIVLFLFILFSFDKAVCQTIDSTLILDANVAFVSKKNKTMYQKCKIELNNKSIEIKQFNSDSILMKLELSKISSAGYGMFKANKLVIKHGLKCKLLLEMDSKIARKKFIDTLRKQKHIVYKDLRPLEYSFYAFDVLFTTMLCIFLISN